MNIAEAIIRACDEAEKFDEAYRIASQQSELCCWLEELKAYKATGLTPEGVVALQTSNQELKKEALPLMQAKIQDRLVVLPCKVGEVVWITNSYMRQHSPPITGKVDGFEVIRDGIMNIQVLIWADLGEGKKKYGFRDDSFGKTIFTSRKEAEAALKEQEG